MDARRPALHVGRIIKEGDIRKIYLEPVRFLKNRNDCSSPLSSPLYAMKSLSKPASEKFLGIPDINIDTSREIIALVLRPTTCQPVIHR